jgi:hypothetical protein
MLEIRYLTKLTPLERLYIQGQPLRVARRHGSHGSATTSNTIPWSGLILKNVRHEWLTGKREFHYNTCERSPRDSYEAP